MPKIYTYKEIQDRVIRRMGRRLDDVNARNEAKEGISDIYTDILSRKDEWQRLLTTDTLTYAPGAIDNTANLLFQQIDNVYMVNGVSVVPLTHKTRGEFNQIIRDASGSRQNSPRYYSVVGSSVVNDASFMKHIIRIYPPCSNSIDLKIDGVAYPADLVDDGDKPRLTPLLCLALIYGVVAYCLDNDEDPRADLYTAKYEQAIANAIAVDSHVPNNWEPVTGAIVDEQESILGIPKYHWER